MKRLSSQDSKSLAKKIVKDLRENKVKHSDSQILNIRHNFPPEIKEFVDMFRQNVNIEKRMKDILFDYYAENMPNENLVGRYFNFPGKDFIRNHDANVETEIEDFYEHLATLQYNSSNDNPVKYNEESVLGDIVLLQDKVENIDELYKLIINKYNLT